MFGSAARNPPCFLPTGAAFGQPFFCPAACRANNCSGSAVLRASAEQLFKLRRPAAEALRRPAAEALRQWCQITDAINCIFFLLL